MKVNLTYQVDFEEVPLEINRFISRASEKVSNINLRVAELNYVPGHGVAFLNHLAETREFLRMADEDLETAAGIAAGYERAVLEQATTDDTQEEEEEGQEQEEEEALKNEQS
tara:strand:+ start:21386 stop:21721 length:336 start_codon:yes stop_codon:yes gene_type:complete